MSSCSNDNIASALIKDGVARTNTINLLVATQKPTNVGLFRTSLTGPAWKTKPSSYLVTTDDKILAPETQRALAKRIQARVEEVAASHLVHLSQPELVTEFVRKSVLTLMRGPSI